MLPRRPLLATLLALTAHARIHPAQAQPLRKIYIAQATPSLAYLPLVAARALDTFTPQGLDPYWAALPGNDRACLAALDRGDVDCAALAAEPTIDAVARGQPVQIVAALLSKLPLELVAGNTFIETSGIAPADDPLPRRLQALKGATIGIDAPETPQDRAARFLAAQAGLDPQIDLHIVALGPPPAIQAALEAGQIDACLLGSPEALVAEDARIGQVLIRMAIDFPALANLPALVLVAKTPIAPETAERLVATCKALQAACIQLLAGPATTTATTATATATSIQSALYPRIKPQLVAAAIETLKSGITAKTRLDPAGIAALLAYAGPAALQTARDHPGFWTDEYGDRAAQ